MHEGLFYWADYYEWEPNNVTSDTNSWISARDLSCVMLVRGWVKEADTV
ncbi:hypothetical protein ACERII_05120 [Evansella sp. AB-rgal1]